VPTKIITASELKEKLAALMTELEEKGIPLYVTQHGKPRAVLARYDDYESLVKKVEDLEDILTMRESLSQPEDEAVSLEDYEKKRNARISN
jgi:prevent-host-death family protein